MSKQHRFSSYIASHRQLWIIGAVFALIYMGNGSFLPYLSLYYMEAGLSTTQIGVITAIGPLPRCCSKPRGDGLPTVPTANSY